jgi:hypothetical protein
MAKKIAVKRKATVIAQPKSSPDILPVDQQEDIDDLDTPEEWYFGSVLWSTDWTTQTIISQLNRGNIDLNPRYQRRNAWNEARKSLFVESLILGLPIPQIILAEDKSKKGSFLIIDGKQRLLSLRQFMAGPNDQEFTQLKLTGLKDRPDLNGMTYPALQQDPDFADELNTFENQTIRTVVIRDWKDERYLYSVFLRINTGSVQLSPQELRQALHPGLFADFIDEFSMNSVALTSALNLDEPDFRMRDVELVLRFFAYKYFGSQYNGNLKGFLDHAVKKLNSAWKAEAKTIKDRAAGLELALATTRTIFTQKHELRKWNGSTYEGRINRAVFDIMSFYFSEPGIASAAVKKAKAIKKAFETLCESDNDFLASIESTTKSIEANKIRFRTWAAALNKHLGTKIKSPI